LPTLLAKSSAPKLFSLRTDEHIALGVIDKFFFGKDAFAPGYFDSMTEWLKQRID
jgi:hypothetical protein